MGTEITKTHFQGILLGDERVSNDTLKAKGAGATDSAYTQAGAYPGTPVPAVDTYMALEASGDQAQDGQLEVVTLRAGHPGQEKAGFGFRDLAATPPDAATEIKGVESFDTITGWDPIAWAAAAPSENNYLDVIRLQGGKLMLTGITDAADVPKIYVYNPSTSVWGAATDPGAPADPGHIPSCLVQLPSGRVLLIIQASTERQLDVYRTDDQGTTWEVHSSSVLNIDMWAAADTVSNRRLSAAYSNGQILLIVGGYKVGVYYSMAQYASDDLGGSFDQVDESYYHSTGSGTQTLYPCCEAIPSGGFVAGSWEDDGAGAFDYRIHRIGTAFQALSETATVDLGLTGVIGGSEGFSLWNDEDGVLYAMCSWVTGPGNKVMKLQRSMDGGATWGTYKWDTWGLPNATEYLYGFDVVSTGGRAAMVSRAEVTAPTTYMDHSVFVVYLGGFSSHTAPVSTTKVHADDQGYTDTHQFGWGPGPSALGLTYIPLTIPDNMGWTLVQTGGTTALTASAQLQVSGGGATRYYQHQETGDKLKVYKEIALRVASGGNQAADDVSVLLSLSDGAVYDHTVVLRFDTAGFALYDPAAGGNILTQALDMTALRHIRVALESSGAHTNAGRVQVWMNTDAHINEWEYVGGSTTVNSGGAAGRRDQMEWGVRANSNAVIFWETPVGYGFDMETWSPRSGGIYAATWVNPAYLHPASFSTYPYLIKAGTKIKAISGPTKIGDSWDIQPGYTCPISAIDSNLHPSPREPWRSTTDAATVDIVWDTETLYTNGYMDNSTIAMALVGCNFKTAVLEGGNGAAWVTIGNINTAEGYASLKFARKGRRLKPDSAQATKGTRYLWFEDHVGDTVDLGASGGEGDNRYHKIAHNTEGAWRGLGVTTKTPTITLATDYLDGAEAATGTMDIWRRDVLLIVHGYVQAYDQFRLRIAAQDTADGYFQIGSLLFGSLAIFGKNHSLGYSTLRSPSVEIVETTGRKRSSRLLGPRRREYELSWTDTIVDNTTVELDDPNPDYVAGQVGGLPIATPYDTIRVVEGILDRVEHRKPIVLCRYIPQSTSGGGLTHQILDRRLWMLCRAPNPLNTTAILGTEGVDEAEQLDTVTFIEEV